MGCSFCIRLTGGNTASSAVEDAIPFFLILTELAIVSWIKPGESWRECCKEPTAKRAADSSSGCSALWPPLGSRIVTSWSY
jgi:hypothetical protein